MTTSLGSVRVLKADARSLPLADASVDLVVTSPPYFGLRSYQDGGEHCPGQIGSEMTREDFLDALVECTADMVRVLKPSGSIFVNLGDKYGRGSRTSVSGSNSKQGYADPGSCVPTGNNKSLLGLPWRYAIRCMDELGLILRAEVIWDKPNAIPEPVKDRVKRSHEQWFHFTKSQRYYANADEIRSGVMPGSVRRVPSAPLRIPKELGASHFAPFPPAWPAWIIRCWSPSGGTVLDPFGGTGTTALAARVLGRTGLTIDLSEDYCRIAEWRTNDISELRKVEKLLAEGKAGEPAQACELRAVA